MNPLRRLWNRRPWRPKGEPSVWEQMLNPDIGLGTGNDWKEVALAQLLGASSAHPDPCDCSLHRLGELVTPTTIEDKDAAFIGNPFQQGGGDGNGGTDTRPQ